MTSPPRLPVSRSCARGAAAENAASQAYERIFAWFAARDWDAMAEIVADEFSSEDRRQVVNAGVRYGRDAGIADVRAIAEVGFTLTIVSVMMTRGRRLALLRVRAAGPDPDGIQNDALNLVEVDADKRVVASVVFDLDNFEAAVAEIDARYLAGEAAAHSRVWSIVAGSYAALNRRQLPLTTPECLYVDHRRETAFGPGDLTAYIGAGWDRPRHQCLCRASASAELATEQSSLTRRMRRRTRASPPSGAGSRY